MTDGLARCPHGFFIHIAAPFEAHQRTFLIGFGLSSADRAGGGGGEEETGDCSNSANHLTGDDAIRSAGCERIKRWVGRRESENSLG